MNYFKMLLLLLFSSLLNISCLSFDSEIKKINITEVKNISDGLNEISGITYVNDTIWAIQDSGNSNELHQLSIDGKLIRSIKLNGLKNHDWEALTSDNEGNVYIGDFGNNDNNRKDLAIYKIKNKDLNKSEIDSIQTIFFYYEDQEKFPPKKHDLYYDCESFLFKDGNFYLFTKNRSKDFDGTSHIYKIKNETGKQKAILINKFVSCDKYTSCAITDAAISSNKEKVVLISNKRMWIFTDFAEDNFTNGKMKEVQFDTYTQREGVAFKDDNLLLIADEKTKNVGGNLYQYKLEE